MNVKAEQKKLAQKVFVFDAPWSHTDSPVIVLQHAA